MIMRVVGTNKNPLVLSVLLKILVLHLVPVHVERSSVALLHRLHHGAALLGRRSLVQHAEEIIARRIHLNDTQQRTPTSSSLSLQNLSQRVVLNAFAVATEGAEGLGRTVSTIHKQKQRHTRSLLETRPVGLIHLVKLDLHLAGEYPTHSRQIRVLLV